MSIRCVLCVLWRMRSYLRGISAESFFCSGTLGHLLRCRASESLFVQHVLDLCCPPWTFSQESGSARASMKIADRKSMIAQGYEMEKSKMVRRFFACNIRQTMFNSTPKKDRNSLFCPLKLILMSWSVPIKRRSAMLFLSDIGWLIIVGIALNNPSGKRVCALSFLMICTDLSGCWSRVLLARNGASCSVSFIYSPLRGVLWGGRVLSRKEALHHVVV